MTTGRINQVARPPRQAGNDWCTRHQPGRLSCIWRLQLWEEREAEAASSYIVCVIRDR